MAKNVSIKVTGLLFVLLVNLQAAQAGESNWTDTDSRATIAVNQPAAATRQSTQVPNFRWQLNYNLSSRISRPAGILDSFSGSNKNEDIFDVQTVEGSTSVR